MDSSVELHEIEKNTVLARLRSMPDNALISVGFSAKPLTKADLIKAVENESELGKEIIEMHMSYLRSFKER